MLRLWMGLLVVAVVLTGCSFSDPSGTTITIQGSNMENTLHRGQRVHFTNTSAHYPPQVGDIVLYAMSADWDARKPEAISRVIAVGGQTVRGVNNKVEVSTDSGKTYRTLAEPYVLLDGTDDSANFGPVTVPAGRLWLMGDHRNYSADSRFHCADMSGPADPNQACDPENSTVPSSSVIAYRRT